MMAIEWKETSLGEVVTLKRGYDLPQARREIGSIPIFSSSGYSGTHSIARIQAPGVVTGRYGTLGKVFYVEEDFWPLNTTLYVKDFKGNNPIFVSYLLRTVDYLAYSDKAAVPGVNRNHLHMARVRIPPVYAQRAIAHILGALDDKIELNRRMNQTLEEMTQAVFKHEIGDYVSKTHAGNAQVTSKEWGTVSLGDVCQRFGGEIRTGPFGTALHADEYTEEGIPVVAVRDIRNGYVEATSKTPRVSPAVVSRMAVYKLEEGDILFGRKGAVDRSAYISANQSGWLMGSDCIRLRLPQELEPKVWSCGFRTPSHAAWMLKHATGTTMASLNQRILKSLPIVVPPEEVLRRTAEAISPAVDTMTHNREESKTLASLRDTLLPKLLSGDLRIDDPEKFLEENVP